jgi:hypothetical protein
VIKGPLTTHKNKKEVQFEIQFVNKESGIPCCANYYIPIRSKMCSLFAPKLNKSAF